MFVLKKSRVKIKMAVVAEILGDLPEMVWNTENAQAYIEGAKDLRVWAAYQESEVVGL